MLLLVLASILAIAVEAANVSILFQFPPGHWVENIAVRANGRLLVVLFDRPEIHEVDPFSEPPTAKLVARFHNKTGIQGITEYQPDRFAIMPFSKSAYSLWTLDLTGGEPQTREVISTVPSVGLLNGITTVSDAMLLASDTKNGAVVRLDVSSGVSEVVLADATMAGLPFGLGAGINGVRVRDDLLYYTNFYKGTLCRVPIDVLDGTIYGPIQMVAEGLGKLDDLIVGQSPGQPSYIMQYLSGSITQVEHNGSIQRVAEGMDYITSGSFGRTNLDQSTLYISSSGNPLGAVARGMFRGGKIYAVKL